MRAFIAAGLLGASGVATGAINAEAVRQSPKIFLAPGEQRLLKIAELARFSLGSDVARAVPITHQGLKRPHGLLIKGVHPGYADLWVWKTDGGVEIRTIQVEKPSPDPGQARLAHALAQLEEAEVHYFGGGAVLRGEITSFAESMRIAAATRAFPGQISDETTLGAALLARGLHLLREWVRSTQHASRLRVEQTDGALWVRGSLEKAADREWVARRVRTLFPPAILEVDAFPDQAPTVYFRVFLLELRKSRFRSFGLSWPPLQEGAFRVSTSSIQNLVSLDLALNELEGTGSARVLSNPELVVRVPGEAELFAGGELPIQMQSRFFSNVNWKPYGLTLKLKATHAVADRVRLEVFTEVSHLDGPVTGDRLPGLQANRMRTQVDARFGTPLFLSGLLQQGVREQAKGLPLLRQIPVLGALFGSEDYLGDRSELVAILYPHVEPPHPPEGRRALPAYPSGQVPPPRSWLDPGEDRILREADDFPWNALQ